FPEGETKTCAIDLCVDSHPNQIVLARLPRGSNLAETLAAHHELANTPPKEMEYRKFTTLDELRVPNMHWKISHSFTELLGCELRNPSIQGLPITTAEQTIEFSLDRSGAELRSESRLGAKGGPGEFYFDRPFLLYIKKRDSEHPLFVMWVEND